MHSYALDVASTQFKGRKPNLVWFKMKHCFSYKRSFCFISCESSFPAIHLCHGGSSVLHADWLFLEWCLKTGSARQRLFLCGPWWPRALWRLWVVFKMKHTSTYDSPPRLLFTYCLIWKLKKQTNALIRQKWSSCFDYATSNSFQV